LKKKLYISLPISGRNLEDVKRRANTLKNDFVSEEYEAVTPFDICPDSTLPYSELMGRDIAGLLECDAVLFDYDWQESKGCRAEHSIAQIYGKSIYTIKDERIVSDADNRLYSMELTKRQLDLLSTACDCQSRNICGQLDAGLGDIIEAGIQRTYTTADFDTRHNIRETVEMKLYEIKSLVWDLGPGTNMGIHYDDKSDVLFDIHQVIRHFLWKIRPEPKTSCCLSASPAHQWGSEPLVIIKTLPNNGK
jgi:hypothetical protein